ncbi:glia maturation factor gamma isoform X2 [Rattus norvegicus]|uniref:Glia maturation factor, gamma n=1 Tax=Rattus norvegicus TaxID=10116 RepID=A0A8I6AD83_RAT
MRRNGTQKGELLRELPRNLGRGCIWEGPWGGRRCEVGGTSRWPIELPFCHGAEEKSPGQSPLGDWVPEEKLRVGHPTLRSRTLPHLGHKLKLETRIQGSLEMSDSLVVCDVDPELKETLRKFRFRKETNNAAIIMKVDKDRQMVVLEDEFQNVSPEELKLELPERQPRFVVYSYKYVHDDGRVSYPLCFIFSSPVGCKPEQQMMYAGSKNRLVQIAELTKVFEIRTTDDLTETWLKEKLAFFR